MKTYALLYVSVVLSNMIL